MNLGAPSIRSSSMSGLLACGFRCTVSDEPSPSMVTTCDISMCNRCVVNLSDAAPCVATTSVSPRGLPRVSLKGFCRRCR